MFEDIPGLACTDDTHTETFMYLPVEHNKAYAMDLTRVNITGFRKQDDIFVLQGQQSVTYTCRRGANRYMDLKLNKPVECTLQYEASIHRLQTSKPVSACYVKEFGVQDHQFFVTAGIHTAEGEIEHTFRTYSAENHALTALHASFGPVADKLLNKTADERARILGDWVMQLLPWLRVRPEMCYASDPVNELRSLMYTSDPEWRCDKEKASVTWDQLKELTPYKPWLPLRKPYSTASSYKIRVEPVFPVLLETFYDEPLYGSRVSAACGDVQKATVARDLANKNITYLLKHSARLNNGQKVSLSAECPALDTLFVRDRYKRHMAMLSRVHIKPVPKEVIERRLGVDS